MNKEEYEWEYELIDDGQFGMRYVKTGRKFKKDTSTTDHCCDWTGPETCPGCKREAEARKGRKK